jgi:hypothetical protein
MGLMPSQGTRTWAQPRCTLKYCGFQTGVIYRERAGRHTLKLFAQVPITFNIGFPFAIFVAASSPLGLYHRGRLAPRLGSRGVPGPLLMLDYSIPTNSSYFFPKSLSGVRSRLNCSSNSLRHSLDSVLLMVSMILGAGTTMPIPRFIPFPVLHERGCIHLRFLDVPMTLHQTQKRITVPEQKARGRR